MGAGLPIIKSLRICFKPVTKLKKLKVYFLEPFPICLTRLILHKVFQKMLKAKDRDLLSPIQGMTYQEQMWQRKVLILAREVGLKLELSDVEIDSLYPKELDAIKDPEKFLVEYQKFDNSMAAKAKAAQQRGCVLRYAGSVDIKIKGDSQIGLSFQRTTLCRIKGK